MRLNSIKLAGFKSFAEPTNFQLPGQLVGVVGPNGCGKSNIMDAVRWVLGESKASELRGESMQDVIFNGTAERKPAARASVELVFDNSLGRIGGSWASYAEISVKRVLTRDGQSTYLINNQAVRRRDVHDMFLGTGLGPRAYAIIGQGMISRIIEARPEDLRVFLEEAAGVSKYKERRRETENRLHDTRENLTRVEDILRELNGQIERLERQAEVAARYRELDGDRESKQQMLWLVRRDEAQAEQQRVARLSGELTVELEARLSEQRSLEAEIEEVRSAHYGATDEVQAAQGRYYERNSEVSRLELQIRHVLDAQRDIRERVQGLVSQASGAEEEAGRSLDEAARIAEDLLGLAADNELDGAKLEGLVEQTPELEARLRSLRVELDQARAEVLQNRQGIELSSTRRQGAQRQLDDLERRRERLDEEQRGLGAPDEAAIEAMAASLEGAEGAEQAASERLNGAEAAWREADQKRAPAQQGLREAEAGLARIEARVQALRQLQERVQNQGRINPWLARHGLEELGRLWQSLRIEHGWETAIEAVLREAVSALKVERLDPLAGLAEDKPPAKVAFFSAQGAPAAAPATTAVAGLRSLMSVVHCPDAGIQAMLGDWLLGWFAADSVETAVAQRATLPAGARFVTAGGHVVDRTSLRLYAPDSEQDGVLARQFELDNLGREQRAERLLADQARDEAQRAEAAAARLAGELATAREEQARALRHLSAVRVEAERLEQTRQRVAMSLQRIEVSRGELEQATGLAQAQIEEESEAFERLDLELAGRQERAEHLGEAFEAAERTLGLHRDALRAAERGQQEKAFAIRERESLRERLESQARQARERLESARRETGLLETRLAGLSESEAQEGLQEALAARSEAEEALTGTRQRADDLAHRLRGLEEKRLGVERQQEPMRQRLTDLQLKEQAARLNAEQFIEQLTAVTVDEPAVRARFADGIPKAAWLQTEVNRLAQSIAGLGSVNMAALEELGEASERKGFLDAQSADLNEAIDTLEDAIRRIDRESREVLQTTYDTVNREFGRLFPELFGGGEARLVLTGDEILDAGVQVMAHPPGKRNSSIHLLSGGEKALTAIALVFAMFHLNPAPFCLLDEVDAPLDDANTERYCDMVRRMSDQTQFLFITHNKIAMELAQQLVGVTMQERGVSRVVAVDLDVAAQMAEAA